MNKGSSRLIHSFWSRPDQVLAEAAVTGELLVAKIRLLLASVLLLIPVIDSMFAYQSDWKEKLVGMSLSSATFFLSIIFYSLVSRHYTPSWLSFTTSAFDVTLVSAGLATFLFLNEPHTAVNSKVVFECYFLAIAATSLRYDKRVCVSAGLLALGQYFAIVYVGATHWNLNSPIYAPYPYGVFDWGSQISRLILMLTASALSLALVSRSQKLLQLATSDPLTGLFNRGYVEDRFTVELSRARRYGRPLTLAVIDADRFKALNDTHGHVAGDAVLRKFGALLRETFRQSDTAARYGGEEFVVVLPETDIEAAWRKVETLRELVDATPIAFARSGKNIRMTISAGLASFPQDGDETGVLFATADERMFRAKREGRNRVVASPEAIPSSIPDLVPDSRGQR
jgi:diguanylate cyclase (GGDEF)-like protein